MTVPAILLAAGASSRLGQPKQLVSVGSEVLLERAIRVAREAGAHPVLVVLGAHFAPICARIDLQDAIAVLNEEWMQGISTSIRAGLGALDVSAPNSSCALIMTCDQPRLTAAHLRALIAAFHAQPASAIAASSYAGVRGTPAIFPRDMFPRMLALKGDKGARSLIAAESSKVVAVQFDGGEIDIDEPADLDQLR
ncbi:MAG TPA: nucleotidyltransferase family protein [Terracidiphilus sp.]|nr:nucleotidyltransferase family protein [Terracidiphilus sp.]